MIGNTFIKIDKLDSTNTYAETLCTNSTPSEGTVITTRFQEAGKGQIGRIWYSSYGKNALLSIILKPSFLEANQQFYLSVITSLALRDVVQDYLPSKKVTVKWPNDVYVEDCKIGGILIQSTIVKEEIKNAILGIGVNINEEVFPKELINPTSLFLESNKIWVIEDFIKILCRRIEEAYSLLKLKKLTVLKAEYEKHLYRINVLHSYITREGQNIQGMITGVSDDGRLIMNINNQQQHFIVSDLKYII